MQGSVLHQRAILENGGEKYGIGISDNAREGNLVGALVRLPHVSEAKFGGGDQERSFGGRPDKDPIPDVGIVAKVCSLREKRRQRADSKRCRWVGELL
jgi:hypothetical protein